MNYATYDCVLPIFPMTCYPCAFHPMQDAPKTCYVWFDTEFTCLDMDQACLLQAALIMSDRDLQPAHPELPGLNLFARITEDQDISPWVRTHLPEVVAKCRSDEALPIAEIDQRLASFVDEVAGPPAKMIKLRPILAGNSIQVDWLLARRFLPLFCERLHYRMMDVSAVKTLWQDHYGGEKFDKEDLSTIRTFYPGPKSDVEGRPHDAYYDIQASMAELNFYRSKLKRVDV